MTSLIVTGTAKADIANTIDYLEREAGNRTAERYAQWFQGAIDRLIVFPESGAPRPRIGTLVRLVVIYPYVMLYDYEPRTDALTILRILHGKTKITRRRLRRP